MKLLVLDRDGVINEERADFVKSADEWEPLPGAVEAIARATDAGFRVVVVSNQSGIGRGILSLDDLNGIHARMHAAVFAAGGRIEAVFFCPHQPEDDCRCRKPRPRLLIDIAARIGARVEETWFIGDRTSDVDAARGASMRPALVLTGHGREAAHQVDADVPTFADLAAAIEFVVARDSGGDGGVTK